MTDEPKEELKEEGKPDKKNIHGVKIGLIGILVIMMKRGNFTPMRRAT